MIGEYALLIEAAVGVIFAMSVMVRRTLQGRIIDAKDSMATIVNDYSYVDDSTVSETQIQYSGPIYLEYEPYYGNRASVIDREDYNQRQLLQGGSSGIYRENLDQKIQVQSDSQQAPPKDAK